MAPVQKKQLNPMYLRKIMVCIVNTFSYNRGTPGGALYLGNIGSPKDRCVSDTCEKKIADDFFGFSIKTCGNPWGNVVGVFPEDQRSKYSKTNDSGS